MSVEPLKSPWKRPVLELGGCISEQDKSLASDLEWSCTPVVQVSREGNMCCFVAVPKSNWCGNSQQAPLLMREFDIVPSKLETTGRRRAAPERGLPERRCTEISVREEDFRRCGNNLDMLRQCSLPQVPGSPAHLRAASAGGTSRGLGTLSASSLRVAAAEPGAGVCGGGAAAARRRRPAMERPRRSCVERGVRSAPCLHPAEEAPKRVDWSSAFAEAAPALALGGGGRKPWRSGVAAASVSALPGTSARKGGGIRPETVPSGFWLGERSKDPPMVLGLRSKPQSRSVSKGSATVIEEL